MSVVLTINPNKIKILLMKSLTDSALKKLESVARAATRAAAFEAASKGLPITTMINGQVVEIPPAEWLATNAGAKDVRRAAA